MVSLDSETARSCEGNDIPACDALPWSGGSATLSVTDNSRRRGGDQVSYTGKYGREPT